VDQEEVVGGELGDADLRRRDGGRGAAADGGRGEGNRGVRFCVGLSFIKIDPNRWSEIDGQEKLGLRGKRP
jgi:hypothetical protein